VNYGCEDIQFLQILKVHLGGIVIVKEVEERSLVEMVRSAPDGVYLFSTLKKPGYFSV